MTKKCSAFIVLMVLAAQAFPQNKKAEKEDTTYIPVQVGVEEVPVVKPPPDYSDRKIGNLIWMRRNLAVKHYRNGDSIPQAQSADEWMECDKQKKGCWCYYESEKMKDTAVRILYNWYAVTDQRMLAPVGYRIPGEKDWDQLAAHYGGKKSCKTIGWGDFIMRDSCTSINQEEFPMVAGGYRMLTSPYLFFGTYRIGEFWSADELKSQKVSAKMLRENLMADKTVEKGYGASVRCVKEF